MNPDKQAAVEAAGFRVGDAEDFLGLTAREKQAVDARVRKIRAITKAMLADPGHRAALEYLARND